MPWNRKQQRQGFFQIGIVIGRLKKIAGFIECQTMYAAGTVYPSRLYVAYVVLSNLIFLHTVDFMSAPGVEPNFLTVWFEFRFTHNGYFPV